MALPEEDPHVPKQPCATLERSPSNDAEESVDDMAGSPEDVDYITDAGPIPAILYADFAKAVEAELTDPASAPASSSRSMPSSTQRRTPRPTRSGSSPVR